MESDLIPYSACTVLPAQAVLVLAPHPDDEVFGCGGAIAAHVRAGTPVDIVVLTDGALYGDAELRQRESQAAAQVLGCAAPEFWHYPDRGLRCTAALVQRLADKLIQSAVDLVYAPSPWEIHPDHHQAYRLVVEAVRQSALQIRVAFYEVGVPLRPNVLLDITAVQHTKEAAMRCFASQLVQQNYIDHIRALNCFRTYTLPGHVLAAEAFWVLSPQELATTTWLDLLTKTSLGPTLADPGLDDDTVQGEPETLAAFNEPITVNPLETTSDESAHDRAAQSSSTVSVLIRTMDRPKLSVAISSVMAQTFTGWEIVLVNASGHALTCLGDDLARQVTVLIEPGEPLHRSAAANVLLERAQGRFAIFLDDDDQLLPDHLHKLVSTLDANAQLIACYSDVQTTGGHRDGETKELVTHIFNQEFDRVLLQVQNYLPIHSVMFRMQAVNNPTVCRFDEELELFEDWDFWLQLSAHGDFKRVPGVSALYALDAATGSGHAMPNGAMRMTMLETLGQRQLTRWRAKDVADLIAWQSQRANALEQAQQEIDSSKLQLSEFRRAMDDANLSLRKQQAEINTLSSLRLQHLQQLEQDRVQIAELNQSLVEQQTEIDTLHREHLQQYQQWQQSSNEHQLQQMEQVGGRIAEMSLSIKACQELAAIELEQHQRSSAAREFAQQLELQKLERLRLQHLQQIEGLNTQLLAMYQSTSWRLMRPLRLIKRALGWISSPSPKRVLRNGLRAVQGEVRRHRVSGFLRRLPHYLRNHENYSAVLNSAAPQVRADLFNASAPTLPATRLHPDLQGVKTTINASVSIVIPTFNAGHEFHWLLRKLLTQKGLRQLEIVIVDSGSQDETVVLAKAAGCRVVEIAQAEFTHSHSRNLGAAHATGDYLIFMVQDAYPIGEYWAHGMVKYLRDHASEGLVAASCSEYSRSDSDMMYDSMIDTHYRFLGCHAQDRIGDFQGADHMALRSRGQLSDVACLISRQLFGQYGYEGDYAEDLDLGIRLIKDGHKVAMLASVKVVHSHNRTAYYYLKRSYVDVIFLVGMFEDFLGPAVESIQGLLAGIVSCARHVSSLLPLFHSEDPKIELSQLLAHWIEISRKQCLELRLEGPCNLGDEHFDRYIEHLSTYLEPAKLDSVAVAEARRFVDSFFGRLTHFNTFISEVYGAHDAMLQTGLRDAVCKTFAAASGSMLGFMYMDRSGSHLPEQALVDLINDELRKGV